MSTSLTYFPKGSALQAAAQQTSAADRRGPDFEMIELIFFAYRGFVGEADRLLARYGFGRAHHRVLHFVNRQPGLTIAALLDILGITKQSLARVLKDLIENGFIVQQSGREDRRQRLLHVTDKGLALANELAERQSARIGRALAPLPPEQRAAVRRFLDGLIEPPAPALAPSAPPRAAAPRSQGPLAP
jgi:DNA-binding MarR family transcriptional regulator